MFAVVAPVLSVLLAAAVSVHADPTPNEPAPGNVFIQGQSCSISWDVDPTGVWKTMDIQLMTGSNFNMIPLTTVATVDGTTQTTFSYPCPVVTPHSPIYFYQFTSPAATGITWTGRFTITDNANDIVPPTQSTQPNGQAIPWGTGSLVNGTSSSAASSASASSSSSAAAASSTQGSTQAASATSAGSSMATTSAGSSSAHSIVYVTSGVTTTATPTSTSAAKVNSAMATLSGSNILSQTVLALGLSAVGFVAMF